MATDLTAAQVATLRRLTDDVDSPRIFDQDDLQSMYDTAEGNLFGAAALLWRVKAASLANKVDLASGQNRVQLSQQFTHAVTMADQYMEMAGGPEAIGAGEVAESIPMANTDDFATEDTEAPFEGYPWPLGYKAKS